MLFISYVKELNDFIKYSAIQNKLLVLIYNHA